MMQNRFPLYLCLKISSFVAEPPLAEPGSPNLNRSAIADTIWLWETWHRVGILNIDVYIFGVTRGGALAGLSTQLVET
jgi:hypothetical protein